VDKARSQPYSGVTESASLGNAQALLTNIRLGRNGLPGKNPLAYYKDL